MIKHSLKVITFMILALFVLQSCKTTSPAVTDAKVQIKRGDFRAASKYLEQALKKQPNDSEALFWMGKVQEDADRYEKMKFYFDKYTKLDPSKIHKAEVEQSIKTAYKSTYHASAVIFNKAVKALQAGKKDVADRTFVKSIKGLQLATKLEPNNKDPWSLLGKVYTQINQKEKAIASFKEVIKIDKNNLEAFSMTASIYQELKDTVNAKVYFNKVLTIEPNNQIALNGLSTIYQKEDNKEKALEIYNMMLASNQKNVNVLFNKGILLKKMNKISEAISTFEKIVEYSPKDFDTKIILSSLYNDTKAFQKTIDLIIPLYPSFSEKEKDTINPYLFNAYIALGNGKEAKKYFKQ